MDVDRRRGVLLLVLLLGSCAPERNLIEEYRRADFGDRQSWPVLDDSYRNRIVLEFDLLRAGRVGPLREALNDPDPFVRSFSAGALGILGDRESTAAIARLVEDPGTDPMTAGVAVQALGWLKGGLETVRSARSRPRPPNRHLLDLAEVQIQDAVDHAAPIREAYRLGIREGEIGSAKVGRAAPEFAAVDTEGNAFRLADAIRAHRVVILVFVSADW